MTKDNSNIQSFNKLDEVNVLLNLKMHSKMKIVFISFS